MRGAGKGWRRPVAFVAGVVLVHAPGVLGRLGLPKGSAFFVHSTDGGATAGCVAIDDATLVKIMRWLRPGAMIALSPAAGSARVPV